MEFDDLRRPCGLPLPNEAEAVDDSPGSGFIRPGQGRMFDWTQARNDVEACANVQPAPYEQDRTSPAVSDSDAVVRDPGTGS